MTEQSKKQPEHKVEFRDLPTSSVAIWKNTSKDDKTYYNFEISYSYKDHKQQWQNMKISLLPSELGLFKDLLARAHLDYQTLEQFKREPMQSQKTELSR